MRRTENLTSSLRRLFLLLATLILGMALGQGPKTLVLVSQGEHWWDEEAGLYEAALREELLQGGFRVLDAAQVQRVADRQLLTRLVQGDALAAITLATNFKADALVVSRVFTSRVLATRTNVATFYTYKATADVRLVMASTGQVVGSWGPSQTGTGTSEREAAFAALRNLGRQVGQELRKQNFSASGASPVVRLTVTGLKGFTDASVLLRELGAQKGVVSAERKSFANGVLEAEVVFQGSVDELAALLESLQLLPLEITEVSGFAIEARVR